jgi:hypothetical protein
MTAVKVLPTLGEIDVSVDRDGGGDENVATETHRRESADASVRLTGR